ncbi:hypothetical protein HFP69_03225 [Streptomyces sp. ARC12]|uniref:hypothetical protein n=1 Tax=Streptomyces sp. ARC12 TaxID=2724151 RepID=UPI00385753A8
MEEYVAGEDLVVLLGPVSEPLRVLLAGRPAQSADRRVDDPSVGVKRQQKPRPPSRAEHPSRTCAAPVASLCHSHLSLIWASQRASLTLR